jgi:hypothetical protein
MTRPKSHSRTATLAAATLAGLLGLWTSWRYAVDFEWLSGSPHWGRVVVAVFPLVAGVATLALVGRVVARKALLPSRLKARWLVFLLMVIGGYIIVRDGLSYSLYFSRPGGLPGGCYTGLELWLRVPHDYSWVRSIEQAIGCALFFSAPLIFFVELRQSSNDLSAIGALRDGA